MEQQSAINNVIQKTYPSPPNQQTLFTVKQYADVQPIYSSRALQNLIYLADTRKSTKGLIKGNGLIECGAIIRVGRKVLIDGDKFMEWVRERGAESAKSRIGMGA